jgi:hypothetical protein
MRPGSIVPFNTRLQSGLKVNTPYSSDSDASIATRQVGADRVYVSGERVVIDAVNPMDWTVREFCRVPIYFEGRKYYLHGKSDTAQPYAKRYELSLWPADLHEESSNVVVYSEAYVALRDESARKQRGYDKLQLVLTPFHPFLGLCWSRFKCGPLLKLGFEPRSITSASIWLVFNLLIVEAIFLGWLRTGICVWVFHGTWFRKLDWLLMVVMVFDTVLRYSQSLNSDVQRHWGFCEWLWPGRRGSD